MSYAEFVEKYKWFELFLEIFKGVMPTIIAIIAIIVNNNRARKRDLEKIKKDNIMKAYLDVRANVIEVNKYIFMIGEETLNYLHNYNSKDKDKYINKLTETMGQYFHQARKTMLTAEIDYMENDELLYDENFIKAKEYTDGILDMLERYDKKNKITDVKDKDELLDKAQQELIRLSGIVEIDNFLYLKKIKNSLSETPKNKMNNK